MFYFTCLNVWLAWYVCVLPVCLVPVLFRREHHISCNRMAMVVMSHHMMLGVGPGTSARTTRALYPWGYFSLLFPHFYIQLSATPSIQMLLLSPLPSVGFCSEDLQSRA